VNAWIVSAGIPIDEVKVKVNMSLFLTKHRAIKTYGGVEVQLHARA